MDESISLNLYENKNKQIKIGKTEEMAPILRQTDIYGEQTIVAHSKANINRYIQHLLGALDDGEHVSLPLERVKDSVAKLLKTDSRAEDYTYKILETADALDAFLDSHQGTYFMTYKKERKANVLQLKDAIMSILENERQDMVRQQMAQDGDVNIRIDEDEPKPEPVTKERLKQATAGVKELSGCMRAWRKRMGEYVLRTPEDIINQKLAIYEAYMDDILVYRNNTEFRDMPKEYKKVLIEYDNLKLKKDLMEWDKSKEGHKDFYKNESMEIAGKIAQSLDDKIVDKKALSKELDKDLSDEQAAGIQDIDRWMIRNFSNGGIAHIEYPQEAFVQKILSLSKRERLYLYFMVETKARKTATVGDMIKSQDYVPNLAAFKNQMLATKFKVVSHFTGAYVYWHKLTEAMQRLTGQGELLESYLKGKKAFLDEENQEEEENSIIINTEQKKNEEKEPAPGSLEALSRDRMDSLKAYYRGLNTLAKAIKENRPQSDIETIKGNVDQVYQELVESDEKVKKLVESKEYMGDLYFRNSDVVGFGDSISGYAKSVVSSAPTIMDYTIGLVWNVKNWDWTVAQEGLEITSGTLGALNTVIGMVGGIIGLYYSATASSAIDLTRQITELVTSVAGLGVGIWGAVESAGQAIQTAHEFMQGLSTNSAAVASTALQKTSVGMAAVGLGMAAFKGVIAYNHHSNLKDAQTYFKTRDEEATKKLQENKGMYSGSPEEIKAQREARFHQNMAKLAKVDIKNKRDSAIFAGVIGGVALASAVMPLLLPLGMVSLGIGIALGAASGLTQTLRSWNSHYTAFDDYFNVDEIMNQVRAKQEAEGKYPNFDKMEPKVAAKKKKAYEKSLRDNIRRQLAAAYGFSNVEGARLYIANTYADYILSVIYPQEGEPQPDAADVAAMESLLKSMGLRINRKKNRPTRYQIRSKLSGR